MDYTRSNMWIEREDPRDASKTIRLFGVLRVPDNASGPLPAVICCHGFTANHKEADPYAKALANAGIASLSIDFFGGGAHVRSDGTLLDMTVETEADDVVAFVDALAAMPEIDEQRIGLLGCSQGGFVVTMVASRIPERIWGLALMYPAYVLHDDALRLYPNADEVPDTYCAFPDQEFSRISRAYNLTARAIDPYELMPRYERPTLIVHGDADVVVPLRYSRRAVKAFPQARLEVNDAGTHGFTGEQLKRATKLVTEFFENN